MSEIRHYVWAVPYSSQAPHKAHLLQDGAMASTHRLCNPSSVVNRELALVVDSDAYRPKCRACLAVRRATPGAVVIVTHRPVVRSGAGVVAAWRKQR